MQAETVILEPLAASYFDQGEFVCMMSSQMLAGAYAYLYITKTSMTVSRAATARRSKVLPDVSGIAPW